MQQREAVYEEITAENICGDGLPLDVFLFGSYPCYNQPIKDMCDDKIVKRTSWNTWKRISK